MKKIFKYFGVLFSVALMGFAVTSCFPEDIDGPEEVGLGIKTVFPTKVVPGLEITVNGSGFNDVTEIVFPEEKSVTSFTKVTDNMLRVVVPNGVAAGKLIVKTDNDQAESSVELTVGKTVVKGFSSEEGTDINGGEQLTIYGEDLEFISSVEFFDPDGASLKLFKDTEFYRKGTSNVTVTLPKKMTEKDVVITGKITTIDGKTFNIYALNYKPSLGGGHWET
ncbi:MAG: IPT/TIG domain-containing protein, partial [Bacteroidales bacterium]|nr:IPT/TIG domain-containing protein [Bacteroidales bacterium]